MPLLSVGAYDFSVAGADGKEMTKVRFFYFPTLSYALLLAVIAAVTVIGLRVGRGRPVHGAWWLLCPAIIGLAAVVFARGAAHQPGGFVLMEMAAVCILCAVAAIPSLRARTWTLVLCLVATFMVFVPILSVLFGGGRGWKDLPETALAAAITAVVFHAPVAVGALLLRGRFTMGRLILWALAAWFLTAAVGGTIFSALTGFRQVLPFYIVLLLFPIPSMVGALMMIGSNGWCRGNFLRAMRLTVPAPVATTPPQEPAAETDAPVFTDEAAQADAKSTPPPAAPPPGTP